MREPSDFEVVTWALDNGWSRDEPPCGEYGPTWCDEDCVWYTGADTRALAEMRAQYAAAHRPSLAERCARAFYKSWNEPSYDLLGWDTAPCKRATAAVQKVLDEAGVSDE